MFTIKELEIIKAALEGDIIRQREHIKDMEKKNGSRDVRFETWLSDSQSLLKKVSLSIIKMKAERYKEE